MSPLKPQTSQTIAGYRLIERIGAGGYGEVWKAEAPGGLEKAVKLIYGYLDDQRAACELKALQRIKEARHPFLLSVERIEVIDGQLVVVTELADMSLKDRFEDCRTAGRPGIPRQELLVYMGDAADALDYMRESHGLQHLDVKPENLLITSGRVKVADFGLVKSIRDEHVSLLGGLTPQYAPPELFDGSPSLSSDQYSLAIVYQEMLTGTPPFPGRTAAQLASQHLHSQPQLLSLKAPDREVIARALSKQPSARFASSRQMVDALRAGDRGQEAASLGVPVEKPPPDAAGDTNSIRDQQTQPAESRAAMPDADGLVPPRREPTVIIGRQPAPLPGEFEPCIPQLWEIPPPAEPVNLDPIEMPDGDGAIAPALVLGIGGTAAAAMRSLRGRILRDKDSYAKANLELLLLDTDPQTIESACGRRAADALEFRETLLMPLRPSVEYRENSAEHLRWLSRRWLYNIPRSLRTQGRRPLGRLAFADHAGSAAKRIRQALSALCAAAAGRSNHDQAHAWQTPVRVFIVASITGGTGSGIVLDTGYLVRQIMGELGLSPQNLCGILTHSTDSNPEQQELGVANMVACLSELDHFAVSGYPGDEACGLAPSRQPAFEHTYLAHLGDNLDQAAHAAAADRLAEYLYLNIASPASRFFDQARLEQSSTSRSQPGVALRTFGITQFDPHHNEITSVSVRRVSQAVVQRWLGGAGFFKRQPVEEYLAAQFPELRRLADAAAGARRRRKDKTPPSQHGRGMQDLLDPESLYAAITSTLHRQLGHDSARYCLRLVKQARAAKETSRKPGFLAQLERCITPRRRPGEEADSPPSDLEHALADEADRLAQATTEAIHFSVAQLLGHPEARITAAQHLVQWLCDRLRQFERATSAELTEIDNRLAAMEAILPEAVTSSRRRLCLRRRPQTAYDNTWLGYCRLRMRMALVQTVGRFLRRANTNLSEIKDQLSLVRHSFERLAEQFDAQGEEAATGRTPTGDEAGVLSQATGMLLEIRMPGLIEKLDQSVGDGMIESAAARLHDDKQACVHRFARTLQAKAWAVIAEALEELDLANRLFAEDEAIGRVSDCLLDAAPCLPQIGGQKRLLVVCPRKTKPELAREGLKDCERGQFSLVQAGESELAFCYELQGLPLPAIVAQLAQNRPNCVMAASRLHTRIDVAWPARMFAADHS